MSQPHLPPGCTRNVDLLPPPGDPLPAGPGPRAVLEALLAGDLDFKGEDTSYSSHNLHAFAARFPPQLPRRFIEGLTEPGEVVLDPMMGSGTTLLEAYLLDRRSIGCDLDPLALLQARVKTTWVDPETLARAAEGVVRRARNWLATAGDPEALLRARYAPAAVAFIQYWFQPATQLQLLALVREIGLLEAGPIRAFMELAFSSIIVTKSGGVSMARDLAHSRPHRVDGKVPRDAIEQFQARVRKNIRSIARLLRPAAAAAHFVGARVGTCPQVRRGDARQLPLEDASVDLVVTSPPYANAIDYMRAHKFSLVWFGKAMEDLTELRARYIGAERVRDLRETALPLGVETIIARVATLDAKRCRVLRKYYLDMGAAIGEMHRVLRPGRAAVIVVGSSTMRGIDVETQHCLAELAAAAGFDVVAVAERCLDRDRRMMPARSVAQPGSLIEARMHREYVIAARKPDVGPA